MMQAVQEETTKADNFFAEVFQDRKCLGGES